MTKYNINFRFKVTTQSSLIYKHWSKIKRFTNLAIYLKRIPCEKCRSLHLFYFHGVFRIEQSEDSDENEDNVASLLLFEKIFMENVRIAQEVSDKQTASESQAQIQQNQEILKQKAVIQYIKVRSYTHSQWLIHDQKIKQNSAFLLSQIWSMSRLNPMTK